MIRKVLGDQKRVAPASPAMSGAKVPLAERPFAGGELVFYADRVELCDVPIVTNARVRQMRKILDALKHRNSAGRFTACSGPELVAQTKCRGGQNGVAGCIRDFRKYVAETLRECLGLSCGPQDVIRSGGPGYRLNEWLTVRTAVSDDAQASVGNETPADVPADDGEEPARRRRQWILAELRKGRRLRTPAIAAELRCSEKTVKRELDALRAEDRIKFVGPSKSGYYRVRE